MKDHVVIGVRVDPSIVHRLDALQEHTGAASRSEVIRLALGLGLRALSAEPSSPITPSRPDQPTRAT